MDRQLLMFMAAVLKSTKGDHTAKTAVNVAEEICEEVERRFAEREKAEFEARTVEVAPAKPKDEKEKGDKTK